MPTVYQQLLACENAKSAKPPYIMAEINKILAQFPNVKHRILPDANKPVTGKNNLLHTVMNMDCKDLSGLAKPGFLGFFSKLGSLGAALGLVQDYQAFLKVIEDKNNLEDIEYFTALQQVMRYLRVNQNQFVNYLASIEHVNNFADTIKQEVAHINVQLTAKIHHHQQQHFKAQTLLLRAKTMDEKSDHGKTLLEMRDIANEVRKLNLLDVYGGESHHDFAQLYRDSLKTKLTQYDKQLTAHVDRVLGDAKMTAAALKAEVIALNDKQKPLEALKKDLPQNDALHPHLRNTLAVIDTLAERLNDKRQDTQLQENIAARNAAQAAVQNVIEQKAETKHADGKRRPGRQGDKDDHYGIRSQPEPKPDEWDIRNVATRPRSN